METLKEKSCLVTGATRGIGRAIAETLLEHGAHVTICGRKDDTVSQTVAALAASLTNGTGGKVDGKAADVRIMKKSASLFRFIDSALRRARCSGQQRRRRRVSSHFGTFRTGLAVYDRHESLRACSIAPVKLCPDLEPADGGYIVNISSLAGKNPFAGGAAYNASKFALTGFSEAVMLDARNRQRAGQLHHAGQRCDGVLWRPIGRFRIGRSGPKTLPK